MVQAGFQTRKPFVPYSDMPLWTGKPASIQASIPLFILTAGYPAEINMRAGWNAAMTGGADANDLAVRGNFCDAGGQASQGDQFGTGDVTQAVLRRLAHIQQERSVTTLELFVQFQHVDGSHLFTNKERKRTHRYTYSVDPASKIAG